MALINCPKCGNNISDKAEICPNCGKDLRQLQKATICTDCGSELSDSVTSCPKCGCPVSAETTAIRSNQILINSESAIRSKISNKKKITIILAIATIFIAVLAVFVIKQVEGTKTAAEQEILSAMSSGDYIGAQALLDEHSNIDNYDKIQEQIMYESIALTCLLNLRPNMKSPTSLQANSIDFFATIDSSNYPLVVIRESGQNGFGGYSSSYSIYQADDLKLTGTCTSLDLDECDSDDLAEMLTCVLIRGLYTGELSDDGNNQFYPEIDLANINNLLSSNAKIKVDASKYKGMHTKISDIKSVTESNI